jgi:hypothetical protein
MQHQAPCRSWRAGDRAGMRYSPIASTAIIASATIRSLPGGIGPDLASAALTRHRIHSHAPPSVVAAAMHVGTAEAPVASAAPDRLTP